MYSQEQRDAATWHVRDLGAERIVFFQDPAHPLRANGHKAHRRGRDMVLTNAAFEFLRDAAGTTPDADGYIDEGVMWFGGESFRVDAVVPA